MGDFLQHIDVPCPLHKSVVITAAHLCDDPHSGHDCSDEAELFVSGPPTVHHAGSRLPLGIRITKDVDHTQVIHHHVTELVQQSVGTELPIRLGDELLCLDGEYIVGMETPEILKICAGINIKKERLELMVQRPGQPKECSAGDEVKSDVIDVNCGVQIWKISASLVVKGHVAHITPGSLAETAPRERDILVMGNGSTTEVYIGVQRLSIGLTDSAVVLAPLDGKDSKFDIDLLSFTFAVFHEGKGFVKVTDKKLNLLRHHSADVHKAYFYITDAGKLTIKRSDIKEFKASHFNKKCLDDFCPNNAALIFKDINKRAKSHMKSNIVESRVKRSHYLHIRGRDELDLAYNPDDGELPYKSDYIFDVINL